MKTLKEILVEKTLTDAELKKREEVAKAIEREHPDMPVDKKMAIATSVAIRSEGFVRVPFEGTTEEFVTEMTSRGASLSVQENVSGKQYYVSVSGDVVGTISGSRMFIYE